MYVNKIDEIVDIIIDDFYEMVALNELTKYIDETNFVKYQKDINKMLGTYFSSINKDQINNILTDEENTSKLIEYIKKYIGYYTMLTLAFYYKAKHETFMNNIIEFTKNQVGFNIKIDNFFNSESNSQVIKYFQFIKNILLILDADPVKITTLTKKKDLKEVFGFLNEFGKEFVDENFRLKNLGGKESVQAHNIIKTIIISEIYLKQDKHDVYAFLEKSEINEGEFIYIDIIVPTVEFIDYNMIEMVLSKKEADDGLASDIYELLNKLDTYQVKGITQDKKIVDLFNSGYVVPVTDEFLLYHKDTENYDKYIGKLSVTSKKKDEPRIKYIVNKIDTISDYYSKNVVESSKKEIEKMFNVQLADRKAVIVNYNEDMKIITKLQTIGNRVTEGNEYYNELSTYMKYPYINFKEFSKYGFSVMTSKVTDAIRLINFDKVNEGNKSKQIQFRCSNPGNLINVVGLIIVGKQDIKCAKLSDIGNIRKMARKGGRVRNGFKGTLSILRKRIFDNVVGGHVYWQFDPNIDIVKYGEYEITTTLNDNERIKMNIARLYDELSMTIYNYVLVMLESKKTSMQFFNRYMDLVGFGIDIRKNEDLFGRLIKMVYLDHLLKYEDKYDVNEDDFPGLSGDVIKLPSFVLKEVQKMKVIKIKKIVKKGVDEEEKDQIEAICQHNISWDNMMAIRKKQPNKFTELLYSFFSQYVEKTYDEDYVCKSCGFLINVTNFVQGGSYDSDGRFVDFSIPMDVPIEDIPEYEKYRSSIRNLEKIIEKLASIFKINIFIGTSYTTKTKIRKLIKDTIDLVLLHNVNLKQIYKERSEKVGKYGVSKNLTNLFIFELDNSIFVYSSKDKDYYKAIKKNNIYIYIIFLMLLELSDNQIIYMSGDKMCNYFLFSKYGANLLSGLKIKRGDELTPISNYGVLCYVLFYMSCLVTKYGLWHYEGASGKKFDPLVQKNVIHTFVDFLNSLIEIYDSKSRKYIYEIVVNKFFLKLSTTFQNEDILDRIKSMEEKKIVDKKRVSGRGDIGVMLRNEFERGDYLGEVEWNECLPYKVFFDKYGVKGERIYSISNVTNCDNGPFHKWMFKGGDFVCGLCGKSAKGVKDMENGDSIVKLYINKMYERLIKKYCSMRGKVDCEIDEKNLENNYKQVKGSKEVVMKEKVEKKDKSVDFINGLKQLYGKTKLHKEHYFKFVDDFVGKVELIVGKDFNVGNVHLRYDTYIINHDHNGYDIDKPIIITDTGNKIMFKHDHPFFKRDVIYYMNNKLEIEVFYDVNNKLLVGFKEKNKDYQWSKRSGVYLIVNTSILNKIKSLGYESKYVRIDVKMEEYSGVDETLALKNVLSDIGRDRINRLKKMITDLQRYIYRFAFNYDIKGENEGFVMKYKNKLNKMVLDNGRKFLSGWKIVKYGIFFDKITDKVVNIDTKSKYVLNETISDYDYHGNLILFYMINEMSALLDINEDKFTKVTLTHLLLDIVVSMYDEFDEDTLMGNNNIKRFMYVLQIIDYQEVNEYTGETEGYYQEYKDPEKVMSKEEKRMNDDDRETADALDMGDSEFDYEDATDAYDETMYALGVY